MRGRSRIRDLLQQLQVLGTLAELVVAKQRPERSSAKYAELFLVHFLEQRALIEFRRPLQYTGTGPKLWPR